MEHFKETTDRDMTLREAVMQGLRMLKDAGEIPEDALIIESEVEVKVEKEMVYVKAMLTTGLPFLLEIKRPPMH